jgi:hypothetical protein
VDYLDLEANQLVSSHFLDLIDKEPDLPLDLFASLDRSQPSSGKPVRVLDFDRLLKETALVDDFRAMLQTLEAAYEHPVDIEFTANFVSEDRYKINLLQCRPLQTQGTASVEAPTEPIDEEDLVIAAHGAVIGQSRLAAIDRFVYVSPNLYGRLNVQARYEVARLLGAVNSAGGEGIKTVMMLGPGRWGTTDPHLGIPINFGDIHHVSVLCEIVAMHDHLVPDVSLGTHFLNEIVERNMLYLALFPTQGENYLSQEFFEDSPSSLLELVPTAEKFEGVVRVIDVAKLGPNTTIRLTADAINQNVLCYFDR